MIFWRVLLLTLVLSLPTLIARAGELDGVQFPDVERVDGKVLHLNGYGLRTWSFLNIHVYTAGLYLEHRNRNPEAIIQSPETKLLMFTFKRDIDADRAREAWRKGLTNNCASPCRLDPADVERFIAEVPGMHEGDSFELRFTAHTALITMNGQKLGFIDQPVLADTVLAAFLGPKPGSPELKQALLAGG